MKKIMMFLFLSGLMTHIWAQQISPDKLPPLQKEQYDSHLRKWKSNRNAGWICLGAGAGLFLTGAIVGGSGGNESLNDMYDDSFTVGAIMIGAGILSMGASVPLFIIGSNHKKGAKLLLKSQPAGQTGPYYYNDRVTGVTLRIPIGK